MMIARLRKGLELTLALDKLPNRVFAVFDASDDSPIGVRLNWFEHKYASSPLEYITTDDGQTFRNVTSYFGQDGVVIEVGKEETLPERMTELRNLLSKWKESIATERQRAITC